MRIVSNAQINNSFYPDTVLTSCNVGVYDLTNFIFSQPWYGATEDYSIVINNPLSATYLWSNGSTSSSISGLSAGTYSCTVTDVNSCNATASVTITEPSPLSIIESVTDVSCNGLADGSVVLTITGGTAPYIDLSAKHRSTLVESSTTSSNRFAFLSLPELLYTDTFNAMCIN